MRVGIQLAPQQHDDIGSIMQQYQAAEAQGFDHAWVGQLFWHDALTLATLAGQHTERIELGTFVIPVPGRHPVALAQQALTAEMATQGRLVLGLGAGHAPILDKRLGLPTDRPVARMTEYLEVLRRLMRREFVKFEGEYFRVKASTAIPGSEPPTVILGALGPRMLDLAERRTDGCAVVFAGHRFIEEKVVPRMSPRSRVVLSIPMLITAEVELARRRMDEYVATSLGLPSYERALREQGVSGMGETMPYGGVTTW